MESPSLKLYKVMVELNMPRSPTRTTLHEVVVLSIGPNSAIESAGSYLFGKYDTTGYVRTWEEVTEFKNNMVLASYALS